MTAPTSRRRARRALLSPLLAAGALLALAGPAHAVPSINVASSVTGVSATGGCSGGSQTYHVTEDITVANASSTEAATVDHVDFIWSSSGVNNATTSGVSVADAGGLVPGLVFAAGSTSVFHIALDITVPCGTASASSGVAIFLTSAHPGGPGSSGFRSIDPFLSNGTPVPVGAVGALVVAGGVGAAFTVHQRRRRSPVTTPAAV